MINHIGRSGRFKKKDKWPPFKNVHHIDLMLHVHVLGGGGNAHKI